MEIDKKREEIREDAIAELKKWKLLSPGDDRIQATAILRLLHSQSVVIKVDGEYIGCDGIGSMGVMSKDCVLLKAGYVAVEPLI